MNIKGIMLHEISQTEKDKNCMISHIKSKKKEKGTPRNREQQIGGSPGRGMRAEWECREAGEGGQKVKASSHTVNKSWGYQV